MGASWGLKRPYKAGEGRTTDPTVDTKQLFRQVRQAVEYDARILASSSYSGSAELVKYITYYLQYELVVYNIMDNMYVILNSY